MTVGCFITKHVAFKLQLPSFVYAKWLKYVQFIVSALSL